MPVAHKKNIQEKINNTGLGLTADEGELVPTNSLFYEKKGEM